MKARPHSGQALVLTLAFTVVLVATFAVAISAGQTVNDKMKLLNAADAAALSAAQWQARSLNYQAYLNRAIVANEVAIGQLVSLRSWSAYMGRATQNLSIVSSVVPPLVMPMRAIASGWATVDRGIQAGAPALEAALSRWNVDVLSTAQGLAHVQAPIVAADLVQQVVRDNEPRAELTESGRLMQARNGNSWLNQFTRRYQRGGGDLRRFADLLMQSRDGFTTRRSRDYLPSGSPLQLSRRGGTDLIGEYTWRGIDTMSLHVDLLLVDAEVPVGWGAAENRRQVTRGRGVHGNSLRRNRVASRLAQATLVPRETYRGIPEIRDITQPGRRDDRELTYSVALRLPETQVPTVDRLFMTSGLTTPDGENVPLAPRHAGGAVHALGTAAVRFERPQPRRDGREEFQSLFSPYWQARLADTPTTDRALTLAERGLSADPFLLRP